MRHLALLRGINVGGNTRVAMSELAAVFRREGMTEVRTYINSGNVVFQPPAGVAGAAVTQQLTSAVAMAFGAEIPLLVRSADSLRPVLAALPEHWANNASHKCDAIFLLDPAARGDLRVRDGVDEVIDVAGVVLWRISRSDRSRTGLLEVMGRPAYRSLTIRNITTLRRLGGLLGIGAGGSREPATGNQ